MVSIIIVIIVRKLGKIEQQLQVVTDRGTAEFFVWYLHSLTSQVLPIGGVGHSVVHLVARIHVQLKVGTHRRLNIAVEPLLDLLTDILVIVSSSELLVELAVGWVIEALDVVGRGRLGRHRHGVSSFAPVQ